MRRAPIDPRTLLNWLGLTVAAGGLLLQFVLSMQFHLANGRDLPAALGIFFSYYTILTNIVLVLVYLSELLPHHQLSLFRHHLTRATAVASIALVGLYVFLVLRHLQSLEGLSQLADMLLHYVSPLLYILWWMLGRPHGVLRWRHIPLMLLPTLIYFVAVMVRGAWVERYPYPFMNVAELGYAQVLLGAAYLSVALIVLVGITIIADHVLSRNWNLVHD